MLDALSLWERVGVRVQRSQETLAHLFLFSTLRALTLALSQRERE